MSFTKNTEKMIFLNRNMVIEASHTWTTSFTTVAGSGPDMLSDDDATSLCKASGSLTTPWIQIAFTTDQEISAIGVCNHTLRTSGITTVYIEYDSTGTPTWTNVDDPGSESYTLSGQQDKDFALIFTNRTSKKFRIRCVQTPTANPQIGFIYVGKHVTFTRNPNSFIQRRKSGTNYIQSTGGGLHASLGPAYRQGELEIGWRYATGNDLLYLNGYTTTRNDNITCMIPPEASYDPLKVIPEPPFFGRIQEVEMRPTQGNTVDQNEQYDIFVSMRGAV